MNEFLRTVKEIKGTSHQLQNFCKKKENSYFIVFSVNIQIKKVMGTTSYRNNIYFLIFHWEQLTATSESRSSNEATYKFARSFYKYFQIYLLLKIYYPLLWAVTSEVKNFILGLKFNKSILSTFSWECLKNIPFSK